MLVPLEFPCQNRWQRVCVYVCHWCITQFTGLLFLFVFRHQNAADTQVIHLRFHGFTIPCIHRAHPISNWIYKLTYQYASTQDFCRSLFEKKVNWPNRREPNVSDYTQWEVSKTFCCFSKGLLNKNHSMICNNQLTIFLYIICVYCVWVFNRKAFDSKFNHSDGKNQVKPIRCAVRMGIGYSPMVLVVICFGKIPWKFPAFILNELLFKEI